MNMCTNCALLGVLKLAIAIDMQHLSEFKLVDVLHSLVGACHISPALNSCGDICYECVCSGYIFSVSSMQKSDLDALIPCFVLCFRFLHFPFLAFQRDSPKQGENMPAEPNMPTIRDKRSSLKKKA
jgi:hypothetical protein